MRLNDSTNQSSIEERSASGLSKQFDLDNWKIVVGGKKNWQIYGLGLHGAVYDARSSTSSSISQFIENVIWMAITTMSEDLHIHIEVHLASERAT